jgi:hypothetical protein
VRSTHPHPMRHQPLRCNLDQVVSEQELNLLDLSGELYYFDDNEYYLRPMTDQSVRGAIHVAQNYGCGS